MAVCLYMLVVVVEIYLRVHILSSFGHTRLQAERLAWPVTLSEQGVYVSIYMNLIYIKLPIILIFSFLKWMP